jgi:hypothetical protein
VEERYYDRRHDREGEVMKGKYLQRKYLQLVSAAKEDRYIGVTIW